MTVEELVSQCAEAVNADGTDALVCLVVTRKRDPGWSKIRLFGRGSPLSTDGSIYVSGDQYRARWKALEVLAYMSAQGLVDVDVSERGDA